MSHISGLEIWGRLDCVKSSYNNFLFGGKHATLCCYFLMDFQWTSTKQTCTPALMPLTVEKDHRVTSVYLELADPRLRRCRSCPACSASVPLPQWRKLVTTTARKAFAAKSGCTAANGSGRSCSCGVQRQYHLKRKYGLYY